MQMDHLEALDLFDDVVDVVQSGRDAVASPAFLDIGQHVLGVGQPGDERAQSLREHAPSGGGLRQRRAALFHPPTDGRPANSQRFQLLLHRRVRFHTSQVQLKVEEVLSDSSALSQTPAETARLRARGRCVAWHAAGLLSRSFCQ